MKDYLKSKIFVGVSVVFLLTLIILYSYRFVHYYRLENPKVSAQLLMAEQIVEKHNNIGTHDDFVLGNGLSYFKGQASSNYVRYSGMMWRILSIDSSHHIRLVLDESASVMPFQSLNENGTDSYVQQWIHDAFLPYLSNADQYLLDVDYCVDEILDVTKASCDQKVSSKVGLLSLEDYSRASGKNGFLNFGSYFWLSNLNDDSHWYVLHDGSLGNGDVTSSYGIRPVIVVNGSIPLLGGTGTVDDPYFFDTVSVIRSMDIPVGQYVTYSDMQWRIVGKNDGGIKLALDGYVITDGEEELSEYSVSNSIYDPDDKYQLAYYLNHTFYDSMQQVDYILSAVWNVGRYGEESQYDYHALTNDSVIASVGLLQIGDLFLNDYVDYYLITPTDDDTTIYTVSNDGMLYADMIDNKHKIRPSIYLKGNISVDSGSGSKVDPYVLGGEINEE